jgi:predicted peroxiredoxin
MTYLGFGGREAVAGGERLIQKGLIALARIALVAFLPQLVARLCQRPMLSVEVLLCGTCMDARGLTDDALVEGARRSALDELAERTLAAERVLVF